MNTILNVPGKTKDIKKSRLDLPNICSRNELHIESNGQVSVPIFGLSSELHIKHGPCYFLVTETRALLFPRNKNMGLVISS